MRHGPAHQAEGNRCRCRSETDLQRFDVLARQAADLVERAQSEKALRENEERLRVIVDQTSAGIAQTDLTGRFELVNERYCEITGYSRDELLGMRMQEITHPEDLPRRTASWSEMLEAGAAPRSSIFNAGGWR
jgi:PAS domain-containing protein